MGMVTTRSGGTRSVREEAPARVLGDADEPVGALLEHAQQRVAVRALLGREELRVRQVLEVVDDGHDRAGPGSARTGAVNGQKRTSMPSSTSPRLRGSGSPYPIRGSPRSRDQARLPARLSAAGSRRRRTSRGRPERRAPRPAEAAATGAARRVSSTQRRSIPRASRCANSSWVSRAVSRRKECCGATRASEESSSTVSTLAPPLSPPGRTAVRSTAMRSGRSVTPRRRGAERAAAPTAAARRSG